jgi:hypothetical protein
MIVSSKYKLYYNSDGTPKFYSMEELDFPYIEVDLQTFENGRYDVRVIDGRIRSLSENIISKMTITEQETPTSIASDPSDVTILVSSSDQHILWDYTTQI